MSTMRDENHNNMSPKDILLARLVQTKTHYLLAFAGNILSDSSGNILSDSSGNFAVRGFDGAIVDVTDHNNIREIFANETGLHDFLMFQIRLNITETFELIRTYCKNTKQFTEFENLDFYHFGRLIRNSEIYDRKLKFDKHDIKKSIFPVFWRKKMITKDLARKGLSHSFFSFNDALDLIDDYVGFVKDKLN